MLLNYGTFKKKFTEDIKILTGDAHEDAMIAELNTGVLEVIFYGRKMTIIIEGVYNKYLNFINENERGGYKDFMSGYLKSLAPWFEKGRKHEPDADGRGIDTLTDELQAYVCDSLCRYAEALNETELDSMCANCRMNIYVCNILNRYATEKDIGNLKCYRALMDRRRYEKSLLEMKEIIESVIKSK